MSHQLSSEERFEMAYEAQEKLREALDLIKKAVRGTDIQSRAESYVIASIAMCIDDNHEYLGNQPCNLDEIIAHFQADLGEEEPGAGREEDEEESDDEVEWHVDDDTVPLPETDDEEDEDY